MGLEENNSSVGWKCGNRGVRMTVDPSGPDIGGCRPSSSHSPALSGPRVGRAPALKVGRGRFLRDQKHPTTSPQRTFIISRAGCLRLLTVLVLGDRHLARTSSTSARHAASRAPPAPAGRRTTRTAAAASAHAAPTTRGGAAAPGTSTAGSLPRAPTAAPGGRSRRLLSRRGGGQRLTARLAQLLNRTEREGSVDRPPARPRHNTRTSPSPERCRRAAPSPENCCRSRRHSPAPRAAARASKGVHVRVELSPAHWRCVHDEPTAAWW